MKLQKRLKGLDNVKNDRKRADVLKHEGYNPRPRRSRESIEAELHALNERLAQDNARRAHLSQVDPVAAHEAGLGYNGPNMPDKGEKDGSCNVTACQLPLAGRPQYFMRDMMYTDRKLYYCTRCAAAMTDWDKTLLARGETKPGGYGLNEHGYRCTLVEDDRECAV